MLGLEELEIGLMFWAEPEPRKTLDKVKAFGLRAGQLGFPGNLTLDGAAERWDEALTSARFTAVGAVCSYPGESYSDIPTVARTVGLVPPATRAERIARTKAVSDIARSLGIDSVACHLGFLPHDAKDPVYVQMIDVAREICDHCGKNGQSFALETGQEPARALCRFIEDVARPNLKINFDPANMILYGTGDPLEALDVLSKFVISVHCKDGEWPPREHPEVLGTECALGKGSVDIPGFISKLKEIGYRGVLTIERETEDDATRTADVRAAIQLLKKLTKRTRAQAMS